ncbi:hypothetical protein BKA69DRAFT_1065902 [Paraphysoderma sedebokerense]|nr:hypothetical protein BKA69DRAFT_1065902 [Paraphysoderma sedebokerense]
MLFIPKFPVDVSTKLHFHVENYEVTVEAAFKKGELVWDSLKKLMEVHKIPIYLEVELLQSIQQAVDAKLLSMEEEAVPRYNLDIEHNIDGIVKQYETQTLKYSKVLKDPPLFPKAYNALINAPISGLFDTLIQLEQSYTQSVEEVFKVKEQDLANLRTKHAKELEANKSREVSELVAKHLEELEIAQATWNSELEELRSSQKREYRDFICNLFLEYQQQSKDAKPGTLDSKTLIATVLNKPSLKRSASAELLQIDGGETGSSSDERKKKGDGSDSFSRLKEIKELKEMGFSKEQAAAALNLSQSNMEQAVSLLLESPEKVNSYINAQTQKQQILNRRLSMESIQSSSSIPFTQSPTAITPLTPKQKKPMWSPLTFLQQQKPIPVKDKDGSTGTNVNLAVKKLGSWIGKAMENLRNEDANNTPPAPPPTESFSITLGTQLKFTYHLHLTQQSVDDLFTKPSLSDMAVKAQTVTGIYGMDVKAIIVPVATKDWVKFRRGWVGNKALHDCCAKSTEFHFEDLDAQFDNIEKHLPKDSKGVPIVEEGDIFITRHSTLPLLHILYHVVIDTDYHKKSDLPSSSPVLFALRTILTTQSPSPSLNLTIPIYLLPDTAIEHVDSTTLMKRAETVLKCIRGCLVERGRDVNVNFASGSVKGVLSLVSNWGVQTSGSAGSGGLMGKEWLNVRSLVTGLFRTS